MRPQLPLGRSERAAKPVAMFLALRDPPHVMNGIKARLDHHVRWLTGDDHEVATVEHTHQSFGGDLASGLQQQSLYQTKKMSKGKR